MTQYSDEIGIQFQRIASDGNLVVSKKMEHASASDLTEESASDQQPWQRSQSSMNLDLTHPGRSSATECGVSSNGGATCISSSPSGGNSVAEHAKVYLDLSKAGDQTSDCSAHLGSKFKISLQTIHQKEEMTSAAAAVAAAAASALPPPNIVIQKRLVRRRATSVDAEPDHSVPTTASAKAVYDTSCNAGVTNSSCAGTPIDPEPTGDISRILQQQVKGLPSPVTIETAVPAMRTHVDLLKAGHSSKRVMSEDVECLVLRQMLALMQAAWAVPSSGRQIATTLCDLLSTEGGLTILVENCQHIDDDVRLHTARLLEQCMTLENRSAIARRASSLDVIVKLACSQNDLRLTKATTGILENLFKHSEKTCADVMARGGLKSILYSCRSSDTKVLQHCAMALANLSIFGGEDIHCKMVQQKVPEWLFPLAFSHEDSIRYYAFLAISMLSSNLEMMSEVLKSGTLDLLVPFVCTHDPSEFARSDSAHIHGQSVEWLRRLVPLLQKSNRKEVISLAAFHFAMEACIKVNQGCLQLFHDINAVKPLQSIASSPNTLASRFATQALSVIGETVPYKLSAQVPLWSCIDACNWLKRINYGEYCEYFKRSKVDGDLLLRITDAMLINDIHMTNGIIRKRFHRELDTLKEVTDYQSCDPTKLEKWLRTLGGRYIEYAYPMLQAGLTLQGLATVNEQQLISDCKVVNGIHRTQILNSAKYQTHFNAADRHLAVKVASENDVQFFISYRRSTGSLLASLLKVHLEIRKFQVFLDIEKLPAGKFDENLIDSVKNTPNFVLVLTKDSLNRCVNDFKCRDWVHKEIAMALASGRNIIPVTDEHFIWPDPKSLPKDMQGICSFNGIPWNENYQDASVNKIVRYMTENPYDNIPSSQPDTPILHGGNRAPLLSGKGQQIRDAFKSFNSRSLDM